MHGDSSMAQIFQDIQHAAARLVAQVCKVDRGLRLSLWSSRFTLDAGLPTHLAGDGYHRGESWSASKTAYKRIVTATKGKGGARSIRMEPPASRGIREAPKICAARLPSNIPLLAARVELPDARAL